MSQGAIPVLDVKEKLSNPISLTSLFEVVADDLLTLNKNLKTVRIILSILCMFHKSISLYYLA